MKEIPRAFINGFKESTDSITLSFMISEYEWPFFLNISICNIRQALDIRQKKSEENKAPPTMSFFPWSQQAKLDLDFTKTNKPGFYEYNLHVMTYIMISEHCTFYYTNVLNKRVMYLSHH
jgi:hypothetical protein